jgi:hypothetical protein
MSVKRISERKGLCGHFRKRPPPPLSSHNRWAWCQYTDKKEYKIFLIYREVQSGAVAKSYMRKGFLIYEEMRKYFPIYEEAVSHI